MQYLPGTRPQQVAAKPAKACKRPYQARTLPGVSGYRGVFSNGKKWRAQITYQGKAINVGTFEDAAEAGRAYDAMAIKLFGKAAITNVTLGLLPPVATAPVASLRDRVRGVETPQPQPQPVVTQPRRRKRPSLAARVVRAVSAAWKAAAS
jgi:hypothetical protein